MARIFAAGNLFTTGGDGSFVWENGVLTPDDSLTRSAIVQLECTGRGIGPRPGEDYPPYDMSDPRVVVNLANALFLNDERRMILGDVPERMPAEPGAVY